ncbi:NAD+ kinase [Favolaschia claudopus]|uniref:NAD+ kinase n=1 Tax=Favolaschia claudopus TaxID=2862362 RepID=A0AAW0DWB4_9AGAR
MHPRSRQYVESIRTSSRAIRQAANVSVDEHAIRRLLLSPAFKSGFKSAPHGLAMPLNFPSVAAEVNLLSLLSLLSFGSAYRVPLHAQTGHTDWERAFVFSLYISSSTDEDDLLSARGMQNMTEARVAEFMRVNIHIEKPHETLQGVTIGELGGPMYELVSSITRVLNETGKILVDMRYPDLGMFVLEALQKSRTADNQADIDVIIERASATPASRLLIDCVPASWFALSRLSTMLLSLTVKARANYIFCFKKALFLVHAISVRFGSATNPLPFPVPSTSQLPVFSDNVLSCILLHLGVLDVSRSSLSMLFPHASTEEQVEELLATAARSIGDTQTALKDGPLLSSDEAYILRAATIDACELIREAARELDEPLSREMQLPSLDNWLRSVAETRPELERFVYRSTTTWMDSPMNEHFSTPPTTPFPPPDPKIAPSLSRRISRPTSLHLANSTNSEWNPDIVLDEASPEAKKSTAHRALGPPDVQRDSIMTPTTSVPNAAVQHLHRQHAREQPMHSPCFVHSHLDKGVSLTDWLRTRQDNSSEGLSSGSSLSSTNYSLSSSSSGTGSVIDSPDEDEEYTSSLTKQLAETAVGVREMSKQLGRARVRSNIQNVLIITKARDNRLIQLTRDLALYLMLKPRHGQDRGLVVYVDNQLRMSKRFDAEGIERQHPELFLPVSRRRASGSTSLATYQDDYSPKESGQLRYWTSDMCSQSPHLFDFVVTLGGDGTVLFTSWLFQRIVPPVLPFALGSLGFLTNFDFADHQAVMDSALDSGIRVNLRMRFTCTVYRAVIHEKGKGRKAVKKGQTGEIMMKNVEQGGWEALEGGWSGGPLPEGTKSTSPVKDKEIMCFSTRAVETFEVINDLVVDRGPSPYVSQLELFGDEHHMTTVQADGLTVSTPTGSTAYSLSAGGSLVHPEIPALLITPICPHTLSFRPMLLPDSMELRICVPFNSRSTAWASFDGRGRVELKQGDHIKVTASKFPFPTVCADNQSTDWFQSISRTLKWNERERQKSFVVVEEDGAPRPKKTRSRAVNGTEQRTSTVAETVEEIVEDDDDDEEEDEEEDKFDIDDSSPEAAAAAAAASGQTAKEEALGREKAQELMADERLHKLAASALRKERSRSAKSRSRSRTRGTAGRHPHVEFDLRRTSVDSTGSGVVEDQDGVRDHINAPRSMSGKSRIPKDREVDPDSVKTPTVANAVYGHTHGRGRGHSRSRSAEQNGHRAFAVWGHDESDSNASDSDT